MTARVPGRCSACHSRLKISVETDGDGMMIDVVDPCPSCSAPRVFPKPRRRREPSPTLPASCVVCLKDFEYPSYCATCAGR